jgi:hypothetical protein
MVVLLVGLVTRHAVDALIDSTMQEATEILYALVQPLAKADEGPLQIMPPSPHDERPVWQVILSQGHLQARSVRAPADPLAPLTSDGSPIDRPRTARPGASIRSRSTTSGRCCTWRSAPKSASCSRCRSRS